MKTGVLFDLDGTLLDTLSDLADSVNVALAHFGCPARSLEQVRSFVGNGARRLITLALPGREDDPPVEEILAYFKAYYADHAQIKTRPYDGVLEQLAALKEKYPVAIVSNKPDVAVKSLCRSYFGDIYALGEVAGCPRKPAPDMPLKAMAAIGVERCVYVGDSDVDVITASAIGAPCLSVLWGFQDEEQIRAGGGSHFCRQTRDLTKAIEELMDYGQ